MSKRLKTSKYTEPGPSRRTTVKQSGERGVYTSGVIPPLRIGARTADDNPLVRIPRVDISSSAFSERTIPPITPPALSTLCARVFTQYFALLSGEDHWASTREWLKLLPEAIIPRLFSMLKKVHPKLLSHAVITTYFMSGPAMALDGELGVTRETVSALSRIVGTKLRKLSLNDFEKFSDSIYASAISKLTALEELNLRNCLKVGPMTVDAITKSCPRIKALNLSSTNIKPSSVAAVLLCCQNLEVLKIAAIQSFTDGTMVKLFADIRYIDSAKMPMFPGLRSLKLRHNQISDATISPLLICCPNLVRLDLSFTLCRHPTGLEDLHGLEKLVLTSTPMAGAYVAEIFNRARFSNMKTLAIGALGSASNASKAMSTGMTLTDVDIAHLRDGLVASGCQLDKINLVGNLKLAVSRSSSLHLTPFLHDIGRMCRYLNLSSIPSLLSEHLEALLSAEDAPSPLEILILNKTGIDDTAAPCIAACSNLKTLEVAETKMTSEGLFTVLDYCGHLTKLNVTGCRGVKVVDRRRFFEAWQERNNP